MIYDDILTGGDAREWLKNKNIKSPNINKMHPLKWDKNTTLYFDNQNIMYNFIERNKINKSRRRSDSDDTEEGGIPFDL